RTDRRRHQRGGWRGCRPARHRRGRFGNRGRDDAAAARPFRPRPHPGARCDGTADAPLLARRKAAGGTFAADLAPSRRRQRRRAAGRLRPRRPRPARLRGLSRRPRDIAQRRAHRLINPALTIDQYGGRLSENVRKMPAATALNKPRILPLAQERRRHQRVKVNLLGRYMLADRREFPCQVVDMSPGGMALVAPVTGHPGERVIAYVDHLGRLEGKIARILDNGFAMTISATLRKRDKLAAQLTWLANRQILNL